jgi:uncharacterized protein (TIGR02270 family)
VLLSRALVAADGVRLAALIRGLEVAPLDGSFAPVSKALSLHSPEHAAALAVLKSFRRASLGNELKTAFESGQPSLQAHALRAARHLPTQYAAAWEDTGLKSDHAGVRLAALETGILHRIPNAWREAVLAVREHPQRNSNLLPMLAILGSETEHQLVYGLLGEPKLQRPGIWALGSIGTQEAASYCISALKHSKLQRMAAEAYAAIVGLDLVRDRMSRPEPDEPTPAFEEDDLDADLVPAREALWPLPDPDALRRHWQDHAGRYQPGIRYVRGAPLDNGTLMSAIETAPMLRRASYVAELRVRSSGKYDVEVKDTRFAQRRMMAAGRSQLSETAR